MTQSQVDEKQIQVLGLRIACCDKRNILAKKWKYIILYEIDNKNEQYLLRDLFFRMPTSFIMYESLNGYHAIGLTPLTAQQWGNYFQTLSNAFGEYYSGETIRLSRKTGETQKLFAYDISHPVLSKLYDMYRKRFPDLGEPRERLDIQATFERYFTNDN